MLWRTAAIVGVFQSRSDRYVVDGYTEKKTFSKLLDAASAVEGLEGIELSARFVDFQNPGSLFEEISSRGFDIPLLIPDTFASPKYGRGSLCAPDPEIRTSAIEEIKRSMDLAVKSKSYMISPWFGNDGFDYILQLDYQQAWDLLVQGLIECADYNPQVKIAIEYKIKEPRTHAIVNSAAKTLLLVNEVDRPNVGVNLDVGHALMGYENMAECLVLLSRKKDRLFHIHVNDNYRYWDDDMIPGSVHTLEWIEFFYWLQRINYTGWLSLDVHPFREEDKVAVAQESINWLKALERASKRLDLSEVQKVLNSQDAVSSNQLLRKALFAE